VSAPGVPTMDAAGPAVGSDTVGRGVPDDDTADGAALEGCSVSADIPEIDLVRPLPGFPDVTRFVLVRLDEDDERAESPLYELRSVELPDVRFLVAVPTAFFTDYAFELDEMSCAELGLKDADEALVLVLLTIGDDAASTTANLLAPVVINARTRSAAQVILSGTDWPVRAAVV
jgi:flagellar assembly factor FliW